MTRPSVDQINALLFLMEDGRFLWKPRGIKKFDSRYAGRLAGSANQHGHIQIPILGKLYLVHVLVWLLKTGEWPEFRIDHKNNDPAYNRFENLRPATNSQNQWNRGAPSNNSSGYKGVSWNKKLQKWDANICAHGKQRRLGHFYRPEDAHEAYCQAARELHGEFFNSGRST